MYARRFLLDGVRRLTADWGLGGGIPVPICHVQTLPSRRAVARAARQL